MNYGLWTLSIWQFDNITAEVSKNTEALQTGKSELNDLRRQKQSLEIDAQGLHNMVLYRLLYAPPPMSGSAYACFWLILPDHKGILSVRLNKMFCPLPLLNCSFNSHIQLNYTIDLKHFSLPTTMPCFLSQNRIMENVENIFLLCWYISMYNYYQTVLLISVLLPESLSRGHSEWHAESHVPGDEPI